MPSVFCKNCQKAFYAKPSWIKNGEGIYCSRVCQSAGRRRGVVILCFVCGKEKYKQKKALDRSKSGYYFCSKACSLVWHNSEFKEQKHGNWKHGTFAYRRILERSHRPAQCVLCTISDTDILLVHHIDKNRKNNHLENLAWLCHNCHHLVHNYKEPETRFKAFLRNHANT
jgi:5-methylcytosine-specific restriction endonuclease McrA